MQFRAVGPVPGGTIQAKGPGLPPGQTSLPTNLVVVLFLHTEHVLISCAFYVCKGMILQRALFLNPHIMCAQSVTSLTDNKSCFCLLQHVLNLCSNFNTLLFSFTSIFFALYTYFQRCPPRVLKASALSTSF
jgi:hypothetical protein